MKAGPLDAITDVPGVLVGHHQRIETGWRTGTTVVLVPDGAVAGVDVRGGGPGTRETDLLDPSHLVQRVQAVCLSGGSVYGLAAADGVVRWLGERNLGFQVGVRPHEVVPIVPAAVLYDLPQSEWGNRPDASFGYEACSVAADGPVQSGAVGAGAGATAGSLRGGIGTASVVLDDGTTVAALLAVNSYGQVVGLDGQPLGAPQKLNTTIGVIATDAALSKAECRRLATVGHDGMARALRPAHSMFDGDTLFALATGARELVNPVAAAGYPEAGHAYALDQLCDAAAEVVQRSIVAAVRAANP
ncbi:peptidase S58 family protein [Pseudonocardiaceae bacterium YIM PH 21723]|nr:peptidase S58 family protein [Pseudonocardiaceae bacterium YIM PH 21723]